MGDNYQYFVENMSAGICEVFTTIKIGNGIYLEIAGYLDLNMMHIFAILT